MEAKKSTPTMMKKYSLGITERATEWEAVSITCSQDAADVIRKFYHEDIEIYESFFMLMLDRAGKTKGYVKIAQGGTAGVYVDVKIVAKYALDSLAENVIIAHNHPSGTLYPSDADIRLTESIKKGLRTLDIGLHDHIILSPCGKHYSFADSHIL